MKMQNRTYDILKWVCILILPSIATLYATISAIWGLPYGEEIPKTITAIATFLGAILGLSTLNYHNDMFEEFNQEEDGIGEDTEMPDIDIDLLTEELTEEELKELEGD